MEQTLQSLSSNSASAIQPDGSVLPCLAPAPPGSLAATGLPAALVGELAVKAVSLFGTLTGFELCQHLRLPLAVLEEVFDILREDGSLADSTENGTSRLTGPISLSERGRAIARAAFARCRYVGPAPVSLDDYTVQCRLQSPARLTFREEQLRLAMGDLVLPEDVLQRLGPAVCGGNAILLHGPSGCGKTAVARALGRLIHACGEAIHVPYAVAVDNQIIAVFDPRIHTEVPVGKQDVVAGDGRWRRVLRPVVSLAAADSLDLSHAPHAGYSHAPAHIKANGGVLVIDDIGRGKGPAEQLLQRWISPLENRADAVTLPTGKNVTLPFESLAMFATHLPPAELLDAASSRRIRHKVSLSPPDEAQFREIFRRECVRRGIGYDDWLIGRLLSDRYHPQIPPKSCDPRDLLEVVEAICRFKGVPPHLSETLVLDAWDTCFGDSLARAA